MKRSIRVVAVGYLFFSLAAFAQEAPAEPMPTAFEPPAASSGEPLPEPSTPPPPPEATADVAPAAAPAVVAPPVVAPAPAVYYPPGEVEPPVSEDSIGVHVALHLGLFAADLQRGHFYAFVSANAGVPMVSNGETGAFALGLGATTAVSRPAPSMWYMDVFGEVLPGWNMGINGEHRPLVAVGAGLGFRYLHRSGFVLGFKMPVFGMSFPALQNFSAAESVGGYYVFNLIALPMVSFGYRF